MTKTVSSQGLDSGEKSKGGRDGRYRGGPSIFWPDPDGKDGGKAGGGGWEELT